MNKLLIICGPTATGKTQLACRIAKMFNGEIVSADSRQIYKGLDIGTGKDLPDKLKINNLKLKTGFRNRKYLLEPYDLSGIPVWMYDVVGPDEDFSVSHYQVLTRSLINYIQERNKLPVVTGGSGLYINSLIQNTDTFHIPPDRGLRKNLGNLTVRELQNKLQSLDSGLWHKMNDSDRQNPRRLMRKIEIRLYQQNSGESDSVSFVPETVSRIMTAGLTSVYPSLYRRIDERVDIRVKQGIIDEISSLLSRGYSFGLPSMCSLGYKEWQPWFVHPRDRSENLRAQIIQKWKYDEHAYARRQMTWFKKQPGIIWFDTDSPDYTLKVTEAIQAWYT